MRVTRQLATRIGSGCDARFQSTDPMTTAYGVRAHPFPRVSDNPDFP